MMGREGKKIHVVVLAMPIAGHINPMLHASFKLASMGLKVTFVNSEYNETHMKLPSLTSSPSSSTLQADAEQPKPCAHNNISFLYIPDGFPPERDRTSDKFELAIALDASYGPAFVVLLESLVLKDPPVTCIISNTFASHVQGAVKRFRLPFISFWPQSAASYATSLLLAKGQMPPKDALPSDVVSCNLLAPGVPHIKYEDFTVLLLSREPDSFMFKMSTNPFKTIVQADGILFNTFEELEPETLAYLKEEGHPVFTVGPLLPYLLFDDEGASRDGVEWIEDEEQGKTCRPLKWLDKQDIGSVLYVSFGTLTILNAEQIKELAIGLEASKQAFLWVLRRCANKAKEEQLPEGFLERTSKQGLVISWAPQLRVLRHEAVGGFLTHCGWNSTLEGMSAGVPLLGWPSFADQGLNCRCIVDKWQVGLSLEKAEEPTGLVLSTEIQKKVVELFYDKVGEAVRANAKQWKAAALKSASHTDGSSVINLLRFVTWLGQL